MLARTYHDFEELRDAWSALDEAWKGLAEYRDKLNALGRAMKRVIAARSICREHLDWIHDDSGRGVPFEDLSEMLNRSPDAIRDKYLSRVPRVLLRILLHGRGYMCPICEAEH